MLILNTSTDTDNMAATADTAIPSLLAPHSPEPG